MRWWMMGWLGLALLVVGCRAAAQPGATLAVVTATSRPTATPSPSLTPSPSPMPSPTATPTPLPSRAMNRVSETTMRLFSLHMTDPRHGWAVAVTGTEEQGLHFDVVYTQDGGLTWKRVTPAGGGGRFSPELLAWDARTAWLAFPVEPRSLEELQPNAVVWRTTDAGRSWQAARVPVREDEVRFFPRLVLADRQHLWLLNHMEGGMQHDYAALFASSDAGVTWQRVTDPWNPDSEDLMLFHTTGLAFLPDGYGLATKSNGVTDGAVVVITQDGGRRWKGQTFTPFPGGVCSTSHPHLWARGQATLAVHCWDLEANRRSFVAHMKAGRFTLFPLPAPDLHIRFFTPREGVAFTPETKAFRMYITRDGGRTWQMVLKQNKPGRAFFADATHFWLLLGRPDFWWLEKSEVPTLLQGTLGPGEVQLHPLQPHLP